MTIGRWPRRISFGAAAGLVCSLAWAVPAAGDTFSSSTRIVGGLQYGQTGHAQYKKPPTHYAFKFAGEKGDRVDVSVASTNGDAVLWVTDSDFKVLAKNDDSGNSVNARVTVTLPATSTYLIIFREYAGEPASFTVSLSKRPPAPSLGSDGRRLRTAPNKP
jgi:hypothetical protein